MERRAGQDGERRAGEKFLALEHDVALILVATVTVAEAYPQLLETIASSLGWQFGAVWEEEAGPAAFVRCVATWCADPHLTSFARFSSGLSLAPGFGLPGRVWSSGGAALAKARELEPDVVLLDIQLPDVDGLEVAERLADGGGPAVVLTSTRDEEDFGPQLSESGARGFVPKDELSAERIAKLCA